MMAAGFRTCTYCLTNINASKWHSHVKHCKSRISRYHPGTNPISEESKNINFWQCTNCKLHNYEHTPQCVACNHTNSECVQSLKLIKKILSEQQCILCKKTGQFNIGQCNHFICIKCLKQYLLNGINTNKWKNNPLLCPFNNNKNGNKCNNNIPLILLKKCNLNESYQKQIENMQTEYMIKSNHNLISCPKCKRIYDTQIGDKNAIINSDLSETHSKHYIKYRFKCISNGCKTEFCSGCNLIPYHKGYTCEEYKIYKQSNKCRFCDVLLTNNTAKNKNKFGIGLKFVCNNKECINKREISCDLIHKCGHNCIGVKNDKLGCIKCINPKCVSINGNNNFNDNEWCNICFVEPLNSSPCIKLQCGHYFHFLCLKNRIKKKWMSLHITFNFLNCPLCKVQMRHNMLKNMTKPYYKLMKKIQKLAVKRGKMEGLNMDSNLLLNKLAYYMCNECDKPYHGGLIECDNGNDNKKKEDLICSKCLNINNETCKQHGKEFIANKCQFCCSIAQYKCWDITYFCKKCHKIQNSGEYLNQKPISELPKCPGKDKCPLKIEHPPNGIAFVLGCELCKLQK